MADYAIGPVPTPLPPKGVNYTPQLAGGQIYDANNTNVITSPSSPYNLPGGAPPPTYTQGNIYTKTPTAPAPTQSPPPSSQNNFDDVYNSMYTGWDRTAAYDDWTAKGRPSPSSTGGSDAYGQFVSKNPYSDITPGWNPADFENELNNIYNAAMEQAGKQSQYAGQLKESNIADIQNQFGVGQQTLDTSKSQTLGSLQDSQISARQQQETALDAARRLYNELGQGYQQRFGGASSAGEAAKALSNVEQQRQMGQTRQGYQDTVRQIETQKVNVEENYKNSLMELQAKRDSAVREANNNFQSAILSIEKDKGIAAQEKALAKMNLLKEYKTELFNIKAQEAQFAANLQLMKEQANIELDSYAKQAAMSRSSGTSALSNFSSTASRTPSSNLTVGDSQLQEAAMTGQINKDELQNYLGQIGQTKNYLPTWMQK